MRAYPKNTKCVILNTIYAFIFYKIINKGKKECQTKTILTIYILKVSTMI